MFRSAPRVFLVLSFLTVAMVHSQSTAAEKMAQLAFMLGDWQGTSTSYSDEGKKQVQAHEVVQYKVDRHVLTIDLDSESLKLHTVIYYDEKEGTYYYCPFYKNGAGKYKGKMEYGRFRVDFNEDRRLWFELTPEGHFHEYGEKRVAGKWSIYFEDVLPARNR